MDLKLTNGDLEIVNGDVSFVTGINAIGQDVLYTMRMFRGESKYDRNMGAPWLELFQDRDARDDEILMVCETTARTVPGVGTATVTGLTTTDGNASVTMSVGAINDEIDFTTELPL